MKIKSGGDQVAPSSPVEPANTEVSSDAVSFIVCCIFPITLNRKKCNNSIIKVHSYGAHTQTFKSPLTKSQTCSEWTS